MKTLPNASDVQIICLFVRPFQAGHDSSTVGISNGYAKSYEVDGRLGASVVELLARNFPSAVDSILMSRIAPAAIVQLGLNYQQHEGDTFCSPVLSNLIRC